MKLTGDHTQQIAVSSDHKLSIQDAPDCITCKSVNNHKAQCRLICGDKDENIHHYTPHDNTRHPWRIGHKHFGKRKYIKKVKL
jgi:hypothetical protein